MREAAPVPLSPQEISDELKLADTTVSADTVRKRLKKLERDGLVKTLGHGQYISGSGPNVPNAPNALTFGPNPPADTEHHRANGTIRNGTEPPDLHDKRSDRNDRKGKPDHAADEVTCLHGFPGGCGACHPVGKEAN